MSTVALKSKAYKKAEEKTTLIERFKKYVMDNLPLICGGIIAMNGQANGYYTYKMLLK